MRRHDFGEIIEGEGLFKDFGKIMDTDSDDMVDPVELPFIKNNIGKLSKSCDQINSKTCHEKRYARNLFEDSSRMEIGEMNKIQSNSDSCSAVSSCSSTG